MDSIPLVGKEELTMPRSHPAYPPELRRRLVELVRSGRSPEELAKKFEPSGQAIRKWVRQADIDEGPREDGLTTDEREEIRRLRRENKALREEREILKNGSGALWAPPARRETRVFVGSAAREERPSAFWCS